VGEVEFNRDFTINMIYSPSEAEYIDTKPTKTSITRD